MPSTLSQFRKHQRILMVMTTGLAMISFVILGAAKSSHDMPAPLVVIALAAMVGGAAWVVGQVNGKSSEYSTIGAVAGAVLGLWLSWGKTDPAAIVIDSGDLTGRQVSMMKRERNLANQFVGDAYQRVNGFNAMMAEQFGQRVLFRYTPGSPTSDVDMAITELLRREADRLGINVSTASVFEYIRSLSMVSTKSLTSEQFAEIRTRLGVSEEQLIDVLAEELKARRVFDLMYSQRPMPTPEELYEYYKKLNLTEEAEVAVLPVSDFVDDKAEPTKGELEELFAKYKATPPGIGPDGKFEEGRPGFRQPPRLTLAYLEAAYDTFEKQAGEVTDKEIEERYERLKSRPFGGNLDSPLFPNEELPKIPKGGLPSSLEGIPPGSLRAPAPPGVDGTTPPAKSEEGAKPGSSAPTAPAPPTSTSDKESPKTDAQKPDTAPPPATEKKPAETAPTEKPADKPSTMLPEMSKLSFVSFQDQTDDERPPPPPAATGASAPAPSLPPAGIEGVPSPPEPPLPTVRPLDDAYRKELKDEILRERTQALMEKKIEEATQWVASEIAAKINTPPGEKGHLTADEAAKKAKEYAQKNGLVYVQTPFLSFQELSTSQDYPVGAAAAINHPEKANVATDAFESAGRSMQYLPRPAASLDPRGEGSRFVYWLTGEREAGEPQNMDDPIVKDQVVKTWRDLKGRVKAEERAAALLKMAKGSDKPLVELFAETSVTGTSAGYVSVRPTGRFSWYRMPVVPTRSMQREASPTITDLPGLKPLSDSFFTTVFDKLKPGEVGTTWSADKSEYYIVKIVSRMPTTPEEQEMFRQTFLARGMANEYFDLYSRDWMMHVKNPLDDLLKRHNVQFLSSRNSESPEG